MIKHFIAITLLCLSSIRAAEITYEANADSSFVGDTHMQKSCVLSEQSDQAHFAISKPIGVDSLFRIGTDWQRYSFSSVPGSVGLPNTLQSLNLIVGFDAQLRGWLVRMELQPGFYGNFQQANTHGFNIPFILGGMYLVNSDLQWVTGVSVNVARYLPVLPAAGVRWKFSKDWVFNAVLPRPRLEYTFNQSAAFYAGSDFKLGTYRMDAHFGQDHGNPNLNNAVLDYTEIRVGGGAEIKVNHSVKIELETGCMLYRQFDFYRSNQYVGNTGGAPYGQIVVNCSF